MYAYCIVYSARTAFVRARLALLCMVSSANAMADATTAAIAAASAPPSQPATLVSFDRRRRKVLGISMLTYAT